MKGWTRVFVIFFFGLFGVHKFIDRNYKMGIIYFLTCGLFGFGYLYDLVISIKDAIFKRKKKYTGSMEEYELLFDFDESDTKVHDPLKSAYMDRKTSSRPKNYIVFDTETTGLYPEHERIIQLSAIKYVDMIEVDRFDCLINPGRKISEKITEITGITNEDLINQRSVNEVLPEFFEWIENYVLLAYNASFDVRFIAYECDRCNIKMFDNKVIDLLQIARNTFPKYEVDSYKLEDIKNYLGIDIPSHRALSDCIVANEVYKKYKELMANKRKKKQ